MRTGAADDPHVIDLARAVWEALGPNEYAVHLRSRPRTYWGFMQGRMWLAFGTLGVVGLVIAAEEAHDRWATPSGSGGRPSSHGRPRSSGPSYGDTGHANAEAARNCPTSDHGQRPQATQHHVQ